jgi:uncharacterized membrane protein
METVIYILVFIAGLITFAGAVLNWEGMYRSRRARGIVSTFGLKGARIVYGIVGLVIMGAAIVGYFGVFS